MKRILGLIMLIVGLIGAAVSIGGIYGTTLLFRNVNQSLDESIAGALTTGYDTLGVVGDTLKVTKQSLSEVNNSIDTVSQLALDVSKTVSDTKPLLEEVQRVTTVDVPGSLDAVQEVLPNVSATAGTIDQTLRVLSAFQVNQSFGLPLGLPPIVLDFDLGIDYAPTEPFDQSIDKIGASLDGLPERLRELAPTLDTTVENVETLSAGVANVSGDLTRINDAVRGFGPLLDQYLASIEQARGGVQSAQSSLSAGIVPTLGILRIALIVVLAWFGLFQILPLYFGYQLLRRGKLD